MADMDIAQRWDIAEVIVYMLMKHLGLNVDSPVKNSDDRWVDFWADYWEYQLKVQVKSAKDTVATVNDDGISYPLLVKNNNILYNYSIWANQHRKGILVLVVVPEDENLLNISSEDLIMKCKIFWHNRFQFSKNTNNCTIKIPKNQQIILENQDLSSILEAWVA